MITFEYNPEKEIIYVKYDGLITLQDLIEYMKGLTEQTIQLKRIKVLEDARDGYVSDDIQDVDEILKTFQHYSKQREHVVIATIQDKPVETALNLLFQSLLDIPNHHYKVFSTQEAAINWLNSF